MAGYQRVPQGDAARRRAAAVEEPASGLWRSQDMSLVRIHFERDNCRRDLLRLGRLGCLQFRDEGNETRAHLADLRRVENLERQLRYFAEQQSRWKPGTLRAPSASASGPAWHENPMALEQIEEAISASEAALRGHIAAFESLRQDWLEWYVRWQVLRNSLVLQLAREQVGGSEEKHVVGGALPLDRASTFVKLHRRRSRGYAKLCPDPDEDGPDAIRAMRMPRDVAGTELDVLPSRLSMRERDELLHDILRSEQGQEQRLSVFVSVSFQPGLGRRMATLFSSMDFIVGLDSLNPNRPGANPRMPKTAEQHSDAVREARSRLEEISVGLVSTKAQILEDLRRVQPRLVEWEQACVVFKAVAQAFGLCRNHSTAGGEDMWGSAWVPTARVGDVMEAMRQYGPWTGVIQEQHSVPKSAIRPTYFPTTKLTAAFQGIVDSYGAPRYKEINPAVFTIITFPWLFGVMYGDIGHGLIIVAAAISMIVAERRLAKNDNEMFQMIFGARYLLLLMGLFATYVGFLYNDFFGLMLEYSPSRYKFPLHWQAMQESDPVCWPDGNGQHQVFCANSTGAPPTPTPFGIDVAWFGSTNKIDVYNSFKEKNAVICGIVQMTLGLALGVANHLYFGKRTGDYKHIWFGRVPEIIFLLCTFGYMCILIIKKWTTPWPMTHIAPNLLESMTNFFLSPGNGKNLHPPQGDKDAPHPLYAGQAGLEVFLLFVAAVCVVPFMLCAIPYIEWKHQKATGRGRRRRNSDTDVLLEMHERGV
eukprot:Hpha_TRINITY_DN6011_c0_g1::TRINITY_DN6011_c0_g1_i1::g.63562::m.63562/K02154/ATPeV0A, ATP6N; V-type H+-transporting ATPase subunit a